MNSSLGTSAAFRERLKEVAKRMASYQEGIAIEQDEADRLTDAITRFEHTSAVEKPFLVGGVDGSGDYPNVQFADSFVYVATANAVAYRTSVVSGLTEVAHGIAPIREPIWLPAPSDEKDRLLDEAFGWLVGRSVLDVVSGSDYIALKSAQCRASFTAESLVADLIRPPAHDAANLAVQLRSTAELGCALRLLEMSEPPKYVIVDTTMSLPLLDNRRRSLFFEHVKRLCCVEARNRGIGFFSLSKSHGLPRIDLIESLARDKFGLGRPDEAEHWFLKMPHGLTLAEGRRIPPPGAVSYLVRFHRNVPVLRLDMDVEYWGRFIRSDDPTEELANECRMFQELDYCGHDQRCYGYPYPVKAGHDRASLTKDERTMVRRLVEDAAVAEGTSRALFQSASMMTGHE